MTLRQILPVLAFAFTAACASSPAKPDSAPASAPAAAPAAAGAPKSFEAMPAVGTQATCPVSGETFTVAEGSQHAVHEGRTYVFCCPGCKSKFEANPAAFIK